LSKSTVQRRSGKQPDLNADVINIGRELLYL
jgi:hypothetical protein